MVQPTVGKKRKVHSASDDEEESHAFMENGILVEKKLKLNTETTQASDASASSNNGIPAIKRRKWQAHNIAEYFFFNDNG